MNYYVIKEIVSVDLKEKYHFYTVKRLINIVERNQREISENCFIKHKKM